jgi:hypothetical protein
MNDRAPFSLGNDALQHILPSSFKVTPQLVPIQMISRRSFSCRRNCHYTNEEVKKKDDIIDLLFSWRPIDVDTNPRVVGDDVG